MDFIKELYEHYHDYMFALAMAILREPEYAKDAVQEALIKIIHNRQYIKEIDCFQTKQFIRILTKNAAIDIYRKRSHIWLNEIPIAEISEHTASSAGFEQVLYKCIMDLPALYRDVMIMNYTLGYSCLEIGLMLSIKEVAVKKRLECGRRILEQKMKKEGIL